MWCQIFFACIDDTFLERKSVMEGDLGVSFLSCCSSGPTALVFFFFSAAVSDSILFFGEER